ncbi:MAG TPA: type II toxin-antitoxin system PemK/MazF family toxin [Thermoanaerobaculia bacterium]|nr:type II toxin-antitoxin system PemK/MazF family toxin [Thermoanaerobaculia bacterium]
MKEGDVAIAAVSQADRQIKKRPVIVLREMPFPGDFLVCGISTQLRQQVAAFDEIISPGDSDFGSSGLLVQSLIRLGFLRILPDREVAGAIGSTSPERHRRLLSALSDYLRPAP